jgi:glycosyltransferase involved in cell wall biosynthesis
MTLDLPPIVYIGGFELPDRNAAAQRVLANALIFRQLGHRVILLGVSRARPDDGKLYRADTNEKGIEAWETGYPSTSRQWFRRIASAAPLRKLLLQGGIDRLTGVICYNFPAIAQARVACIARRHGGWAAADCTEWYGRLKLNGVASLVKNLDVPLRMRIINRFMDGLITTSPFVTTYYGNLAKPIIEIPTLIEYEGSSHGLTVRRPDGVTKLFFAGTGFERSSIDGLKDRLDWVLEVLDCAKSKGALFSLEIYGVERSMYLALTPAHEQLLTRLDTAVRFHGRQPRSTVISKLTAAHFSIFFRKRTRTTLAGFPAKFAESISFGVPVITNYMPSTGQYMHEREFGYHLDPADPTSAADKLVEIMSQSDDQLTEMKERCVSARLFHPDTYLSRVDEWLKRIETYRIAPTQ